MYNKPLHQWYINVHGLCLLHLLMLCAENVLVPTHYNTTRGQCRKMAEGLCHCPHPENPHNFFFCCD